MEHGLIIVDGIYFKASNGIEYAMVDCPFCGRVHFHGYGDGPRVSHCGDYSSRYGSGLLVKRSWLKNSQYHLECKKIDMERKRLLAKNDLENYFTPKQLPHALKRIGKKLVENAY